MAEYEDVLSQNVDEVKKAIRNLDDPDYTQLLLEEKEGKDRKTIKEFLQSRIDTETEDEEEAEEEVVEEIEEETSGGLFGSFSRTQLAAAGVIFGVVLGFAAAMAYNPTSGPSTEQVEQRVSEVFEASGSTPDSVTATRQNGLFMVEVNSTATQQNETRTTSQTFYVSPDGELLIRSSGSLGRSTVYEIDELLQRLAEAQQQRAQNRTNSTQ